MSETVDDLLRSLKVTAGSRFNASKRLEHIDRRMTLLTSFTSAYLILLSIIPTMMALPDSAERFVTVFAVGLAVLLLAASVSSYANGYAVKAEQYHRSALEIQEIRRELRFLGDDVDQSVFLELSRRYNSTLQKYSINHSDVDFYRYQLEYSRDYQLGSLEGARKRLNVYFAYTYPTLALTLITGGIAVFGYVISRLPAL